MADIFTNKHCDDALIKLAKGDMSALAVIYDKLGRKIFMLAFSILHDKDSAEDVMQDVFLRLAAEAHTYKEKSNAIAFILTVTRNLSLNLLAKRRRDAAHQRPLESGEEIADSSAELYSEKLGELGALRLLDDDERQIVVMKLDAKMKHKDIAAILGISEDACQKRYRRALEKLRAYYK